MHYHFIEMPLKDPAWLNILARKGRSRESYRSINEVLKESTGTIKYEIPDNGVVLTICIRASVATTFNPVRFTLHVAKEISTDSFAKPKEVNLMDVEEMKRKQMKADREMNDVVKQLTRELEIAKRLTQEIDLTKELEYKLFDIGQKINRMSGWFPILKMMILFIGGFVQFQQMMSFLKKRNIF